MTKRKGRYLDRDRFKDHPAAIIERMKDWQADSDRARADADFAEMAEADFRRVLGKILAAVGGAIERKDRDGVLDLRAIESALAEANQTSERLIARSDAHYAERQAELDRQQEAERAAQTALEDDGREDAPEPGTSAGEPPAGEEEPSPYVMPLLSADDEPCDPAKFPAFLRRNAA